MLMVAPFSQGLVDIPEEKAAKFRNRGFLPYVEPKPEKKEKKQKKPKG